MVIRTGSCRCGAVRFEVAGEPLRTGLCHCTECRKTSGSVFSCYAVWPRSAFTSTGTFSTYAGDSFCSACGSQMFSLGSAEAEIKLGSLDQAPTGLSPTYELWIKRREGWLHALPGADQFAEDRV